MLHRTHAARASLSAADRCRMAFETHLQSGSDDWSFRPKSRAGKQTTPAGGGDPASVALFWSATGRRSVADPNRGALGGGVRRPDRWVEDSMEPSWRVALIQNGTYAPSAWLRANTEKVCTNIVQLRKVGDFLAGGGL